MKITRKIVSEYPAHVIVTYTDDDGRSIVLDSSDLPANAVAELLSYGAGRFLSDRTSASDKASKMDDMQAVLDDLTNGITSKRSPGQSAQDKVEEATARLAAFNQLDANVKAAMEQMGMGKAFLEKNLSKAITAQKKAMEKASKPTS